jgi:regulator of PEP synthase PpsR (kinase-PPPase family)
MGQETSSCLACQRLKKINIPWVKEETKMEIIKYFEQYTKIYGS